MGAVPPLVALAVGGEGEREDVRRKAVYALSSECRNFQGGMDALVEALRAKGVVIAETDASDMDAIDTIMADLREGTSKMA